MKAKLEKSKFIGLDRQAWFYCGAEAPVHEGVRDAVLTYLEHRTTGPRGRDRNAETEWKCKQNIAALLHGEPEHIAIMSNSSEAISMVARALPFAPGDNVVVHVLEFPSGILPWLALQSMGVEVRVVEHNDYKIEVDDIMAQVDSRTRLVVTSHVSYLTGARIDYRGLYERLLSTDTLLLLDATQSLGVIPVDMTKADLVVCSTYKWLLSTHGGGILAVNPARASALMPAYVGWRSISDMFSPHRFERFTLHTDAKRFELGYPAYPMIYALEHSTGLLLKAGIEAIEAHVLELGDRLIERLRSLNLEVMTPVDRTQRAGNISFLYAGDAEAAAERLYDKGIYLWGGDGRLRASIHGYNDAADIDRLAEALPECL